MNTHGVNQQDVMAYLDGELSAVAAAEMASHLASCRMCQETAADLQSTSRQLAGWVLEDSKADGLPEKLAIGLDERETEQVKRQKPGRHWLTLTRHSWVTVGAALIVIPALLLSILTRRDHKGAVIEEHLQAMRMAAGPEIASLDSPPEDVRRDHRLVAVPTPAFIVHTAQLRLTARNFDSVQADLERVLSRFDAHWADMNVSNPTNEARNLTATLRVPSPRLETLLSELRKLGHVDRESQRGEEVTQQSVDLEARLANARRMEQRLTQILATRTGKLSDVLEVEEKLGQIRGQIEQAEAEQKSLKNRVSFASVALEVSEDYRAPLATGGPSTGGRLRNAAVDGLHRSFNAIVELAAGALTIGPSVLLFGLLFGLPGYWLWKKLRR